MRPWTFPWRKGASGSHSAPTRPALACVSVSPILRSRGSSWLWVFSRTREICSAIYRQPPCRVCSMIVPKRATFSEAQFRTQASGHWPVVALRERTTDSRENETNLAFLLSPSDRVAHQSHDPVLVPRMDEWSRMEVFPSTATNVHRRPPFHGLSTTNRLDASHAERLQRSPSTFWSLTIPTARARVFRLGTVPRATLHGR